MFKWDNTANIKELARRTNIETPPGDETYAFHVGDDVESTAVSRYKEGTHIGEITERYVENGYCYYVAGSLTWRQKDIRRRSY